MSALALAGLGGALGAAGCGDDECGGPEPWDRCPVVNPDGTSNGYCAGKCVPLAAGDFSKPLLLWMGPEESEPSCEDLVANDPDTGEPESFAPVTSRRLRLLRPGEEVCGDCVCGFPHCELPQTVAANSLSSCEQTPEATNTPFNPPAEWGGGCVSPGTVPSSQVGSIWIGPVTQSLCTPSVDDVPPVPEGSPHVAVACSGRVDTGGLCPDYLDDCMVNQQEAHVPPEWRYCVVAQFTGLQDCEPPAAPGEPPVFSERFLMYKRDLSDPQNCEPCVCVTTTPGQCEARVSAYADRHCSDSALIGRAEVVLGEGDACLQFEPGPALGSFRAEWEVAKYPGCTPIGGEPHPTVVCCLPEPEA
ncbi:hypothetical protein WMF30_36540 [Sorangium sp. So ce134]